MLKRVSLIITLNYLYSFIESTITNSTLFLNSTTNDDMEILKSMQQLIYSAERVN